LKKKSHKNKRKGNHVYWILVLDIDTSILYTFEMRILLFQDMSLKNGENMLGNYKKL